MKYWIWKLMTNHHLLSLTVAETITIGDRGRMELIIKIISFFLMILCENKIKRGYSRKKD